MSGGPGSSKVNFSCALVSLPSPSVYCVPPLGLGYLASSLEQNGFKVKIIDCVKEGLSVKSLISTLISDRPGLTGFQLFSVDLNTAHECMGALKLAMPGLSIVAGGPHPTGMGSKVVDQLPTADYSFQGEAERGIVDLARRIESGAEISHPAIPGLIRKTDNEKEIHPPYFEDNLDSLPWPAWDQMDPRTYPKKPHGGFYKGFPIAPVITGRGCPFSCSFCASPVTSGKKLRLRSIEGVLEEVKMLSRNYGVKEIHIVDDVFTAMKERSRQFFERVIESGLDLYFAFPNGFRIDSFDKDLVKLMKRAGVYSFTVGIESGSQRILDHMGKGTNLKMIREKISLLNSEGIEPNAFFMIGYPEETRDDIEATIKLSCELKIRRAHFSNFLPLPGTPITERLRREGNAGEIDYSALTYSDPSFPPPGMGLSELKALQRKAYLSFYLKPGKLMALLRDIRSAQQATSIIIRAVRYLITG